MAFQIQNVAEDLGEYTAFGVWGLVSVDNITPIGGAEMTNEPQTLGNML